MKGFDLQMEIMLVLIIAIFTAIFFRCIFEWTINKCSAMESVDAFVVAKQQGMIQQQIPNAGDATGGHGFTLQEQPWYKITFRMTDSTEKEFNVDNQSFRELKEGEKGILTYQGTRYLGFKKDS
ncbi:DUF2500 domain-containing protein [Ruminococcus sp. AM44-9AT]|jgi:hypothetical protein|nr:DUF2500 domain-containing protein [Blautia sp.]MBD9165274.1 DUF2500 domain-containing protein [Blautia wexlerae]RHS65949.1 DUF2500 domain-containing protein [Ruminococcus sp. AM46-18]RHS75441.1 DUF2500 domain-containing protein [Ruminococcus sp. AM44-9AT]